MKKIVILIVSILLFSCMSKEEVEQAQQRYSTFKYTTIVNLKVGESSLNNGILVLRIKSGFIVNINGGTIFIPQDNF